MAEPKTLLVLMGNQLFAEPLLRVAKADAVFMSEEDEFCQHVPYHQHKLVLILAGMRAQRDALRAKSYTVHYSELEQEDSRSYEEKLLQVLQDGDYEQLAYFEIEGRSMARRMAAFADAQNIACLELASPMFLCPREAFAAFVTDKKGALKKRPLMANFYKEQRHRLDILLNADGSPTGGQWSFDADNRRKLPKDVTVPEISTPLPAANVAAVQALVSQRFASHPGSAESFWWPTTHRQAKRWLLEFIDSRLDQFGPYEDAMTQRSDTVFHSAVSPLLNVGLLIPQQVIDAVLVRAREHAVPLASLEGFVRQVIGWREFIRGIYRHYGPVQASRNYWDHQRDFGPAWSTGETGIVPLDAAIQGALKLGWSHHIPRLMVLANLMTLCEIHPQSAHRWFMQHYVDSANWVMGPNVYGMGLFSDGGIFATKPYICGSNYLLKMSDYKRGPWTQIVDGLYWRFINLHRDFFTGNPRLGLMVRALDKMDPKKKQTLFAAAEEFIEAHTVLR